MYDIKQVIVVRTDLNMRKGKIAAQVAHASMKVFFDRARTWTKSPLYKGPGEIPADTRYVAAFHIDKHMYEWVRGSFAKIVLGVESEEELLRCYHLALEANLPAALIQDAGYTEFHGVPTYTAVAIGPERKELIDLITGTSGSVRTKLL